VKISDSVWLEKQMSFFLLLFGSVVVFVGCPSLLVVLLSQHKQLKRERGPKKKIDEEDEGYLSIWLCCLF